jgi:hypothetical protein
MTDIVTDLRGIGKSLGSALAGYRDRDNHRAAAALTTAASIALDAADEIERLRTLVRRLIDELPRGAPMVPHTRGDDPL